MPSIAVLPQNRMTAAIRSGCAAAAAVQVQAPSGCVAAVTLAPGLNIPDDAIQPYVAAAPINASYAVMFVSGTSIAPADPTAPGYVLAGIATQSGAPGASITVRSRGAFAFSGWSWAPGEPVFVLPGGTLTQTAPDTGVLHQVGAALDAVTLLIEPGEPVYL